MKEFQEKKRFRKIIFSKGMLFVLFLLILLLSFSLAKMYIKSRQAVVKNEEAKKDLAETEKRMTDLERDINRLQSESGIEEEIRKNLNMSKPGEEVLVIVDKKEENDKIEEESKKRFFEKIWEWVINIF